MKFISYLKSYTILAVLPVLAVLVSSCLSEESKLAAIAEVANKQCPMAMEPDGTITGVKFDRATRTLTYEIQSNLDPEFLTMKGNVEWMKRSMFIELSRESPDDEDINDLLDLLIKCNGTLEYVFNNIVGAYPLSVKISTDELKKLRNSNMSEAQLNEENLNLILELVNSGVTEEYTDGLRFKKVYNSDDVVIVYEADETLYDMKALEQAKDELRSTMLDEVLSSPDMEALVEAAVAADKGLVISYEGSAGTKGLQLRYTPEELGEINFTTFNRTQIALPDYNN